MSRQPLIIALVATVLATAVLAAPERRLAEVESEIERAGLDEREVEAMLDGLEAYVKARNASLDRLVRILKDDDTRELEDRWLREVDGIEEATSEFWDALDDVGTPSVAALALRQRIATEENTWIAALRKANIAARRDEIVLLDYRLEGMKKTLEDKSARLLRDDEALDEQQRRVVDELKALLEKAINETAAARRGLLEGVQDATELLKAASGAIPGSAGTLIGQVSEVINHVVKVVNAMRDPVGNRAALLRRLIDSERSGVLVLYNETRRDTDLFVRANGFDLAKSSFEAARKELNDFASSAATAGQRSDANDFRDLAIAALGERLAAMEKRFNAFVVWNKDKFLGPASPQTIETLVEKRYWTGELDAFRRLDLDGWLRSFRQDGNSFFGVSTSGLTSQQREWLGEQLRKDFEALADAVDDTGKVVNSEVVLNLLDRSVLEATLK
jgi:hypothetical protein